MDLNHHVKTVSSHHELPFQQYLTVSFAFFNGFAVVIRHLKDVESRYTILNYFAIGST
jgi:hypothetical protein